MHLIYIIYLILIIAVIVFAAINHRNAETIRILKRDLDSRGKELQTLNHENLALDNKLRDAGKVNYELQKKIDSLEHLASSANFSLRAYNAPEAVIEEFKIYESITPPLRLQVQDLQKELNRSQKEAEELRSKNKELSSLNRTYRNMLSENGVI